MRFITSVGSLLLICLSACTWVKPEAEAAKVVLVKPIHAESCKKLGTANATTKAKLAGVNRGAKKVASELLTLAQNEAVSMGGNTLVATTKVLEDKQSFSVFFCE